jgi:methionyl-tRNA formyltransferase
VRVLFWGTPEFATPPLRALVGEGFDVAAVVTRPDKPVGRSRSVAQAPPVKQVALEEGIQILQPDAPRGDDFLAALRALAPDISVVVAYGHILPQTVIDVPRLGTINIHASLLPALRGAAPIHEAIRTGLAETGISIMQMVARLDAGPVIHRVRTPIADDETSGELMLRLSELGALAAVEALAMIELGRATAAPQDEQQATYAPKIERPTTRIDWAASAREVSRLVRAYDPRPGAFAVHGGTEVKLFGAKPDPHEGGRAPALPGTVVDISDVGMIVACGSGALRITSVQPAGKRRLAPAEWAHGRGIALGQRLT